MWGWPWLSGVVWRCEEKIVGFVGPWHTLGLLGLTAWKFHSLLRKAEVFWVNVDSICVVVRSANCFIETRSLVIFSKTLARLAVFVIYCLVATCVGRERSILHWRYWLLKISYSLISLSLNLYCFIFGNVFSTSRRNFASLRLTSLPVQDTHLGQNSYIFYWYFTSFTFAGIIRSRQSLSDEVSSRMSSAATSSTDILSVTSGETVRSILAYVW